MATLARVIPRSRALDLVSRGDGRWRASGHDVADRRPGREPDVAVGTAAHVGRAVPEDLEHREPTLGGEATEAEAPVREPDVSVRPARDVVDRIAVGVHLELLERARGRHAPEREPVREHDPELAVGAERDSLRTGEGGEGEEAEGPRRRDAADAVADAVREPHGAVRPGGDAERASTRHGEQRGLAI